MGHVAPAPGTEHKLWIHKRKEITVLWFLSFSLSRQCSLPSGWCDVSGMDGIRSFEAQGTSVCGCSSAERHRLRRGWSLTQVVFALGEEGAAPEMPLVVSNQSNFTLSRFIISGFVCSCIPLRRDSFLQAQQDQHRRFCLSQGQALSRCFIFVFLRPRSFWKRSWTFSSWKDLCRQ